MKSFFSATYELLDMDIAAEELVGGLAREELGGNTLGILFCDSELENYELLLEKLRERVGFDIIGCTTQATINQNEGISEMNNCLLVMSAEDVRFHIALTRPLRKDNFRGEITAMYREALDGLDGEPRMILMFPPHNYDIMIDHYPNLFTEIAPGIPVFGGIPGFNAPYGVNAVLYNERMYSDRMLMVLLEGGVKPLFSVAAEISRVTLEQKQITRAEENVAYEIEGMTVPEYLESLGIDPVQLANDETDSLFVSNPAMLTLPGVPQEEYRLIRTFHKLDLETGAGTALGLLPQGHNIAIGALTRRDVQTSTEHCVADLLAQIAQREAEDPSYKYSTILCISCAGRYLVLHPETAPMGEVFKKLIPDRFTYIGYYSYGEFVPIFMKDGKMTNTAQNESLALCAL